MQHDAKGQDDKSAEPGHGQFLTTRWSMVLEAVQSRAPGTAQALAELYGSYWRPLYGFARALLLLRQAAERLEEEQARAGKATTFRVLKGFLGGGVNSPDSVTYEEASNALGVGVPNVPSLIHRLRRRQMQLVREEVERTLLDPTEVDTELHGLCEALVRAEGRVSL